MEYQIYPTGLTIAGVVAKGAEFNSYEYQLVATMVPSGPTPFSNRNLSFFNDNAQGLPVIIDATTSGGARQQVVNDGDSGTLDLTGLDCTVLAFKWQIGIYTLSCPQALSGYLTWGDV
jgi:hypothetical protein